MTSGIYKIVNTINGYFYLGSSSNIERRWGMHKSALNNNRHHSIYLQRAWNKYKEENFQFLILIECDGYSGTELLYLEQIILNDIIPGQNNYNMTKFAGGGDNLSYHPNKKSIIERRNMSSTISNAKLTKQERKEKFGKLGPRNGMYGNHHTEETKLIIGKKVSNYYETNNSYRKDKTFEELFGQEKALKLKNNLSKTASERVGDKNPFYGKTHSKETKIKLSKKQKGIKPPNRTPIFISEKYYDSLHDAYIDTGIPVPTILWRVNSKNKKFSIYRYATINEIEKNRLL